MRGGKKCGYRASLVGEIVSDVDCYVGAEIPPAGAPAGFDSAAMFDFIA